MLAAAALAFGSAGAAQAAASAAGADELCARFACPSESSGRLCTLADGRTVPAQLKHQIENSLDRLDRLGLLPDHPGLSRRAIVEVLSALASFDDSGVGARVSQLQIAARSRFSDRHVRDVLAWAAGAGVLDSFAQYMPEARTLPGALAPVTHDRRTVYVLQLVPRELARGASEELLLELAAAADPPLRLDLGPRTTWDGQAVVELAAAPQAPPAAPSSAPGPAPAAPAAPSLPPELVRLPGLLEQLAAVADGVRLDAADIAALGASEKLAPLNLFLAVEELARRIQRGETRPADDPHVRWSARSLRARLHTFCAAKRRDGEAAQREAAQRATKAREASEWASRAPLAPPPAALEDLDLEAEVTCTAPPCSVDAALDYRIHALRAELQIAEEPRATEIRQTLTELERPPP